MLNITTIGLFIAERPRRLAPDKLKTAKAKFKQLMELGICKLSSNPWASSRHLVCKKNSEWRACGDYCRLNSITIPDKYPAPHLHDFSSNLARKTIFYNLDLCKAYYQIPVTEADVLKKAVITLFELG